MARRVGLDDILQFNQLYYRLKNFTEVARRTDFSVATVRKYTDRNWKPPEVEIKRVGFDVIENINTEDVNAQFRGVDNYGDLCVLTDEEKEEMKKLWEEMSL